MKQPLSTLVWRSLRLRCPVCGQGRIFRSWFRMHEVCNECDTSFGREPGFFLGSVYFNYGLTAVLTTTAYITMYLSNWSTEAMRRSLVIGFAFLFPIWFFRYARSLWLGFDQYIDPRED